MMRVREVMSYSPTCCTYSCTAQKAALIMQQDDIGFLPVIDTEATRKLIGVVTDRDLCLKVVATGRDPALVWAHECMTSDPVACGPEDEVETALQLMEQGAVRRLPVIDSRHQIVGVVSLTDIVHHTAATAREVYVALSRISEPRRKGQVA
jgi:CBS domain-containing protein